MNNVVHVLAWNVDVAAAEARARVLYPEARIRIVPQRQFREAGSKGQLRMLHRLNGDALIFCFAALADIPDLDLLALSGLIHRCRRTILADLEGHAHIFSRRDYFLLLPKAMARLTSDLAVLAWFWLYLHLWLKFATAAPLGARDHWELMYLFPYRQPLAVGGAATHVRGFLRGWQEHGAACCRVFTGCDGFPDVFPATAIRPRMSRHIVREAATLLFNWRFARAVRGALPPKGSIVLYQRHGRYTFAGALLARWLKAPFILEYNGSEVWVAQHWDPARLKPWLQVAEELALRSASLLVVVSNALRDELLQRGIPSDRILVNPNGVDPREFQPGRYRAAVRQELGFSYRDVLVCFVGSFSYWHGVGVLTDAIRDLCTADGPEGREASLRFVLIGTGPLHSETKAALQQLIDSGQVFMPGGVEHGRVAQLLDAADIVVSPHVPMPDGRRFFGSPTKIFEYMASDKAIVASALDQIADVLEHDRTALLVPPRDVGSLADAIALLSQDAALRERLGHVAREVVCNRYTWTQNAARVSAALRGKSPTVEPQSITLESTGVLTAHQ